MMLEKEDKEKAEESGAPTPVRTDEIHIINNR